MKKSCGIMHTMAFAVILSVLYTGITNAQQITVTSPNGGEVWYTGTSQDITWFSAGTSGNVHIEYSADNGSSWTDIISSTADIGSCPWTIPNQYSTACLVRITDTDGEPQDLSDAVFTINNSPNPNIIFSEVSYSHGGDDFGNESCWIYFHADITDPQGLNDINSVVVTAPDNVVYNLYDDGQHDDYSANDGRYGYSSNISFQAPVTGAYAFTVTDNSSNTDSADDTLHFVMDYPRNLLPANNEWISVANPTLSWDVVPGATSYSVYVRDANYNYMWNYTTATNSVTYNFNGSGISLTEGNTYYWSVSVFSDEGYAFHYDVSFIYSSNTDDPIAFNPVVSYTHSGDDQGNENYEIRFYLHVADPQGLSDISSVTVTAPDNVVYHLFDDGQHNDYAANDGSFGYSAWGLTQAPLTGAYVFTVTDNSANTVSVNDTLKNILDYPRNISPPNNGFVTTANPTLSWDAVTGASGYYIDVYDINFFHLWGVSTTSTSVVYNYNGYGTALTEGNIYYWMVGAYTDEGNSRHYENRFVYTTDIDDPIASNPAIRYMNGGNDEGNTYYGLRLTLNVMDPQGLSDISTVTVTAPGHITYELYDDGQHDDGGTGDGLYGNNIRSLSQPAPAGVYVFTVTDHASNIDSATYTVNMVLDYPKNLHPANNEFVSIANPTLSWDAVPGATSYNVYVYDINYSQIWGVNTTENTVAYNYNGQGTSLTEGNRYYWNVNTYNDAGDAWHFEISFVYSTNTTDPVATNPVVRFWHSGDDAGNEYYEIQYSLDVTDPQGLSDIVTVTVTAPDNLVYTLFDDGQHGDYSANDGRYGYSDWGLAQAPLTGAYVFTVTDNSANTDSANDTLYVVLDYPRNLSPANNEWVAKANPTLSWDIVPGATSYSVYVRDMNYQFMWSYTTTSNSVAYNYNGQGTPLTEGNIYYWNVSAHNDDGNAHHNDVSFIYSSSTDNPVASNPEVTYSHYGDDEGNEYYEVRFSLYVIDPQGLSDIDSVTVMTPDNTAYTLYDDGQHGDWQANDGRYGYSFWNSAQAPLTGAYVFTVTDHSMNTDSANDTLHLVLDYPRNIQPPNNGIVTSANPVFSWDLVSGATNYHVNVYDNNYSNIWSVYTTSNTVVYNYDGSGAALTEGNIYYWNISANNDEGSSMHTEARFIYTTDPENPIISNPVVRYSHFGNDEGNEEYYFRMYVNVADPQGLSDINSVTVTAPDNTVYTLYDDGQHSDGNSDDGIFGYSFWSSSQAPLTGAYIFVVTDNSSNTKSANDTLHLVLDFPRNIHPANNEIVTSAIPTFRWDAVSGATSYNLYIYDKNNNYIWDVSTTDNSVAYNFDGRGASLIEGNGYYWYVYAENNEGYSRHNDVYFAYSTEPTLTAGAAQTAVAMSIDGNDSEAIWSSISAIPVTKLAEGSVTNSDDFSATYKLCWDNTNLYLLFEISDDVLSNTSGTPWLNDAVELYFDMNNSRNVYNPSSSNWTAFDFDDRQIRFVWEKDTITGYPLINGVSFEHLTNPAADGYKLEIAIPWSSLGLPAACIGVDFGFDVSLLDNDGGIYREAVLNWNSPVVENWRDPSKNGITELRNSNNELPAGPMALIRYNGYYRPSGTIIRLSPTRVADGLINTSFELKNAGLSELNTIIATATGTGYSITSAPAGTLASKSVTGLQVGFDASEAGQFSGMLQIISNDPLSPYVINLKTNVSLHRTIYVSKTGSDILGDGSQSNPYASIQFGIGQSLDGDTIMVLPGTYYETISFIGDKRILTSEFIRTNDPASIEQTIIDGSYAGTVVYAQASGDNNFRINGFTIQNGQADWNGGINCYGPVKLSNLIVRYNNSFNNSGGICFSMGNAELVNSKVYSNHASNDGGGIMIWDHANPIFKNVLIYNNNSGSRGAGVWCGNYSHPEFINVTIANNGSNNPGGTGIHAENNSEVSIINSIIWENYPYNLGLSDYDGSATLSVTHSSIAGGIGSIYNSGVNTISWNEGNISLAPGFADPGVGLYQLLDESPCVNSGIFDTTGLGLPATDLGMNPRVFGGWIDMGAYENQSVMALQHDLSIVDWLAPTNSCDLTANEPIIIRIQNNGLASQNAFDVNYSVDYGNTVITETVSQTINPGGTLDYTFSTAADFSQFGTYRCFAHVILADDGRLNNNSLTKTISAKRNISAFPFTENFESGTSEYFYLQANDQAGAYYEDLGGNIVLRLNGRDYWGWTGWDETTAENAWNDNISHHASAKTCTVDATSVSTLELLLDLRQEAYLPKLSWFRVLVNGNPVEDIYGKSDFNPNTSYTDPFTALRFDLSAYAGSQFELTLQASNLYDFYIVQIDNIILREKPAQDVGITALLAPISSCVLSDSEPVTVKVSNLGAQAVSDFGIGYRVNGMPAVSEIIAGPLNSGETMNYTFATPALLSQSGESAFALFTSLTGDEAMENDTLKQMVYTSTNLSAQPFTMGFENNDSIFSLWRTEDVQGNYNGWHRRDYRPRSGEYDMYVYGNNSGAWLLSNCFYLEASKVYGIDFWYCTRSENMNLKIGIGNDQSGTSMTSILGTINLLENAAYKNAFIAFNVPVDGLYYFGWQITNPYDFVNCFLDDIKISVLPDYNAALSETFTNVRYTQTPLSQVSGYNFGGWIVNKGALTETGVTLSVDINNGLYQDHSSIASLAMGEDTVLRTTGLFLPTSPEIYSAEYVLSINEVEADLSDNTATASIVISDTVYARDNNVVWTGISYPDGGCSGHSFDIVTADTLTSVSVYTWAENQGDPFSFSVYESWNDVNASVGSLIYTSDTFEYETSHAFTWQTFKLSDYGIILVPGTYAIVMNTYLSNSIAFGLDNSDGSFVNYSEGAWHSTRFGSLLLRANFGHASAGTGLQPPVIDDFTVVNGTDLQFSFGEIPGTATLNAYRDTIAFFTPDKSGGTNRVATHFTDEDPVTPGLQWTDENVIGDAALNYFYIFTLVNGSEGGNTATIGAFDFALVTTTTTDFNEIALPVNIQGVTNAGELMAAIPGCNSIARWNAGMQGYEQYVDFIEESNFDVSMGYPYYVNIEDDVVYTLVGEIASPVFNLITTSSTDFNEVMLPLDKTAIHTASELMSDIPSCNSIARWSAPMQGYEQYVDFIEESNFGVNVGYPYYVNVDEAVTWPSAGQGGKKSATGKHFVLIEKSSAPHLVYGTIKISNAGLTMDDLDFCAYFPSSPEEKLGKSSAGCMLKNGIFTIQCNTFTTGWDIEEPLKVEIRDKNGLVLGSTDVTLSYNPADKAADFIIGGEGSCELSQNRPNPFAEETVIEYQIADEGKVMLEVYSLTGQKIKTLVNEYKQPGSYEVTWNRYDSDDKQVPDGLYIYLLRTSDQVIYKKATVVE
jgi:hypothetical protein